MFVELHILQNFAPSNLNRDDTNTPKDCDFGGVRRARISSQCLKRAIREAPIFTKTTAVKNGVRTRWIARILQEKLEEAGKSPEEAIQLANEFAVKYGNKVERPSDSNLDRTAVLIYFSPEEIEMAARALTEGQPAGELVKELVKKTRGRTSAPDVAMFGRMLANAPVLNLDAACQVAHAISTHAVNMEMDFYTAVDELQRDEESGAGMMGTTGFNSATFYRYARINYDLLCKNLDGDVDLARCSTQAFLLASIAAIPGGKQNSHAAYNPPSFLLAVVRKDSDGWSLANAFEKPVRAGHEGGLMTRSIEALAKHWTQLAEVYGDDGLKTFVLTLEPEANLYGLPFDEKNNNRKAWITGVTAALAGE